MLAFSHLYRAPCESCGMSQLLGGEGFWPCRLSRRPCRLPTPLMRGTSLGFWISLDSRHHGARVPRTDIRRHANRAVLHDFSAGEILALPSLLSPPLVPSVVLWPTPLATATTGSPPTAIPERITRSMSNGRRPRWRQTRTQVHFFATGTVRPTRSIYACTGTRAGEITTRAVGRLELGLWYLVRLRRPF